MGRSSRRRDRWPKRGIEALVRLGVRPRHTDLDQIRSTHPQRILVVRQHNEVGDFLLATPALHALRRAFPDAEFHAVVAPRHEPLVRNHPDLDGALVFDREACLRPHHAVRFLRRLRGLRPDLAFVLNTVSFSATSTWIAVLSGAPWIVGSDSRPFGWRLSGSLYAVELAVDLDPNVPAVERSLRPLRALGIGVDDDRLRMRPDATAVARAERFVGGLPPGERVAVHPGAGKPENRWPAARFAAVITALRRRGAVPWIIEGPADAAVVVEVESKLDQVVPVLRGVSLDVVAAAIASSDVALVNDTGLLHVAAAMGTTTIALFGPTRGEVWAPPGEHVRTIQEASMGDIPVDQVLKLFDGVHEEGRA